MESTPAANPTLKQSVEPAPVEVTPDVARVDAVNRMAIDSSANWFYWIAALSVINSFITMSGSHWNFIFGLTFTKVVDALATQYKVTGLAAVLCIVLNALAILTFAILGYLARRCNMWAFIVGLVLCVMDALLILLAFNILALAFHAYLIFQIVLGIQALRRHQKAASE